MATLPSVRFTLLPNAIDTPHSTRWFLAMQKRTVTYGHINVSLPLPCRRDGRARKCMMIHGTGREKKKESRRRQRNNIYLLTRARLPRTPTSSAPMKAGGGRKECHLKVTTARSARSGIFCAVFSEPTFLCLHLFFQPV